MTSECPGGDSVARLRSVVARRLGLALDDGKTAFVGELLRRRLQALGGDCETYLARLEGDPGWEEIRALAAELTVGETYFFRNREQFHAFREVVLPQRLRSPSAPRRLRFLSAGCASGEEAFSIAMVVREAVADPSWEVSIRAVDVNRAMLARAERARFSSWALRETPAETQGRWFRQQGPEAVLDETIRTAVRFEERNLAAADAELFQPGAYDAIFCRNVVMYFTPEQARALVARLASSLAPGGFLFLGHAETLRGLSHDFDLLHSHDTFYYQRRGRTTAPWAPPVPAALSPAVLAPPLAAVAAGTETWVEAISRSADRIQALASPPAPGARAGTAPDAVPATARWDLGLALELLREERFAEALDRVQALPAESALDPDVLLLSAVLFTHQGRLSAAEEVCRRLLAVDGLSSGAHYVLALCREGAGDRHGAADHDQVAVYLDPAFSMPRLHLGLLARRAGDRESARRELGQAAALLEREEPSRLLLFGGGFHRDALLALCRAELAACGGTP